MKNDHTPFGPYEKHFKRPLDCVLAIGALVVLSPLLGAIALLVKIKLGSPVIFSQIRPGMIDTETGRERLFKLYKFRTMTDERDSQGNPLPDDIRLKRFGKVLRSTSLDELPELVNIIRGDMALIGPRPQLVRDMVFMTEEQRQRHSVRPGLSGLAQIRGRNAISWEKKLGVDLEYIKNITFLGDIKIMIKTLCKAVKREGISDGDVATALDYGDYLLRSGKVQEHVYFSKQEHAKNLLDGVFIDGKSNRSEIGL